MNEALVRSQCIPLAVEVNVRRIHNLSSQNRLLLLTLCMCFPVISPSNRNREGLDHNYVYMLKSYFCVNQEYLARWV